LFLAAFCTVSAQTNITFPNLDAVTKSNWLQLRENTPLAPGVLNTNIIAVSDWSQIVMGKGSLRARMVLAHFYPFPFSDTILYIELQNAQTGPVQFYFDPGNGLHCKLVDAHGNTPPQMPKGGTGRNEPVVGWVSLLEDATIRLRANTSSVVQILGHPPIDEGDFLNLFLMPSSSYSAEVRSWDIPAGDTNDYYLSGTLTLASPTNSIVQNPQASVRIFQRTLELPKMKISLKKQ
jgi:hypothetical protein